MRDPPGTCRRPGNDCWLQEGSRAIENEGAARQVLKVGTLGHKLSNGPRAAQLAIACRAELAQFAPHTLDGVDRWQT